MGKVAGAIAAVDGNLLFLLIDSKRLRLPGNLLRAITRRCALHGLVVVFTRGSISRAIPIRLRDMTNEAAVRCGCFGRH
jgi:hypothetical protein